MRFARVAFGTALLVGFALMMAVSALTSAQEQRDHRARTQWAAQAEREFPSVDGARWTGEERIALMKNSSQHAQARHDRVKELEAAYKKQQHFRPPGLLLTAFAAWASATLVWLVTYVVARRTLRAPRDPDAWRKASLVVPMVAVSLIGPATIQLLLMLFSMHDKVHIWFLASTVMMIHVYIAVAWMAGRRAARVADGRDAWSPKRIWLVGTAIGAVPWIFSVMYVAATGLPFLWILGWPERALKREQIALSADEVQAQSGVFSS